MTEDPGITPPVAPGFKVVIPARYASTRLPGKPLRALLGRPMLQHVHECACRSGAGEIVIATDDERIRSAAETFGAAVCMTSPAHPSGTDRLAEVVAARGWPDDAVIVNLQSDEPLMPPELVAQVANDLSAHSDARIATLATPIESAAELFDPDIVKVVCDNAGYALFFSRAPIPWDRDACEGGRRGLPGGMEALRHIGLYAYRASFLWEFRHLKPAPLEITEKLEQLRALWHGDRIHVGRAALRPGPGVDTEAQMRIVEQLLGERGRP
jgi:3-deoxy-manno-octulosonate cytidylyltransferase (CMP-KDO synthetase)